MEDRFIVKIGSLKSKHKSLVNKKKTINFLKMKFQVCFRVRPNGIPWLALTI